jgi:hypothetical protein
MELLSQELRQQLPPIYAQEANNDPMVYARFYLPDSNWEWYVTEGSPESDDFLFFGYVRGNESEWGRFLLSDLEIVQTWDGRSVLRDLNFKPAPFTDIVPADE